MNEEKREAISDLWGDAVEIDISRSEAARGLALCRTAFVGLRISELLLKTLIFNYEKFLDSNDLTAVNPPTGEPYLRNNHFIEAC